MSSNKTSMLSHTTIYGLATITRNITGLIMLPIYTRYLKPDDYAVLELLTMAIDLVGIIVANRIGDAIFRFYMTEESPANKRNIISTSFFLSLLLNSIGLFIVILSAEQIALAFFGDVSYQQLLILFSFTLIAEALVILPMHYMRAQEKPMLYLITNLSKLVSQVSLNIYFVVIKGYGVDGVVYSTIITAGVAGCILTIWTFSQTGFGFNIRIAKSIFLFSLPIGIGTIASFVTTYGDRFFIRSFHSLYEVGIYTLAYKFAFIYYSLFYAPFNQVWDARKYLILKEPNPSAIYSNTFSMLNLALISAAFCIALFIDETLAILSEKSFWPAASIVPPLLLAYLFYAWSFFGNFGILYKQKTSIIAYSEWGTAGVIIGLYYLFVPTWGATGAAFATLIALFARFLVLYYVAKSYYDMGLNFSTTNKLLALAITVWVLSEMLPAHSFVISLVCKSCIFLAYLILALTLPILNKKEKTQLFGFLQTIRITVQKKIAGT